MYVQQPRGRQNHTMPRSRSALATAALMAVAALSLSGVAAAAPSYPPPKNPLKPSAKPKGPFQTHTVCAKGCMHKTIQEAVNDAKAGDTIKVSAGVYKERIVIKGPNKRSIKIIGDPKHPEKVVLEGKGSKPLTVPNNAVSINGSDNIVVNGLTAQGYNGYGFFVINNNGYTFTNLIANDQIGLIFLIPGKQETLRVGGRAIIVRDIAIREQLAVKGKLPEFAIIVAVEQMFFHCAKCMIRSSLWTPESWPTLSGLSTLAETLVSAGKPDESVEQLQEQIDKDAATNLY